MAQWQNAVGLDLAQRKTGMDVFHVGQIHEAAQREARKTVQVARHYLQLESAGAADVVAGDHLRQFADGLFQQPCFVCGIALGVESDKSQHAEPDFVAVDGRAITGDEPFLLQRAHAAPAGCRAQPHTLRELCVGQASVGLKLVQDGNVELIQSFHF